MNATLKIVIIAGMLVGVSAHAGADFTVVGAGVMSEPAVKNSSGSNLTYKSKLDFGGGVLVGVGVAPMISLELGLLYLRAHYTSPSVPFLTATMATESTAPGLALPISVRVSLLNVISVGAGPYFGMPMGKIHNKTTITLGGVSATTESDSTLSKKDYGVQGSLGLAIPFAKMAILLEGRYFYGLSDLDSGSGKFMSRTLVGLLGARFSF